MSPSASASPSASPSEAPAVPGTQTFKHSPGCLCCLPGCWTWEDDFDREDSTECGSWLEVEGDWEIKDAMLYEPSTSGTTKKIIGTVPAPERSAGEMAVSVKVINPAIDDEYFIFLACDEPDTGGGIGGTWVKYTYTGTNEFLIELPSGESKTLTCVPAVPGEFTISACVTWDGFLWGDLASSLDEYPWSDDAGTYGGRYYGVGHGDTSAGAYFDDFYVRELKTETQDCGQCFCHCDYYNVPKELALTVVNANPTLGEDDRAYCMDGEVRCMYWFYASGASYWLSAPMRIYCTTPGYTTNFATFQWKLICGDYDPNDPLSTFSLTFVSGCCNANPGGCLAVYNPISLTCDPLTMTFGPFYLDWSDLTCFACHAPASGPETGEYYIVITIGSCPSPSLSPSASPSISPSASASPSASPSEPPGASASASPSESPSASPSEAP